MIYTKKIQKAVGLAAEKHLGQKRKSTGLPFIVHPFAVALILLDYTKDEDIIAAGLLHDVLEDAKNYGFLDMKRDFGLKIAEIVREVSENKFPDGNHNARQTWETRKKEYLKNLQNASQEALMVSAADKIHNLKSIIKNYEEQGDVVWKKFNAPPDRKFWYYREAVKILKRRLKHKIIKRLENDLKIASDMYKKNNRNNKNKNNGNNIFKKLLRIK